MSPYRDRRVPDWLYWIVLERDRFAYVGCGNSPSLDPRCRIAAVRVAPLYRPGRPDLDGTWTLCLPCCRRITGTTPRPRDWKEPFVDDAAAAIEDEPPSLLDRLKDWLRARAARGRRR